VISRAEMLEARPVPQDAMVVSQVSRWDPLKDHAGLAQAFCAHKLASSAHLILAGPSPDAISDDPEGRATLGDLRSCVESLPSRTRDRVHVACLPMDDIEENGAIVNALQRRSQIVVQKSLAEGFGLTVTEAMWKARPVVASAVGGIQDQIQDGRDGVLVDDASDLSAFASSIAQLLTDRSRAEAMGLLAHESVLKNYLMPTYLERYLALIVEHVRT
ncbi:MAG: glycosyltransferase, partial [Acidimicrobiales bacterium]